MWIRYRRRTLCGGGQATDLEEEIGDGQLPTHAYPQACCTIRRLGSVSTHQGTGVGPSAVVVRQLILKKRLATDNFPLAPTLKPAVQYAGSGGSVHTRDPA